MDTNNVENIPKQEKKINWGNETLFGGIICAILGGSIFGWLVIVFTVIWGVRSLRLEGGTQKTQAIIGIALAVATGLLGFFAVPGVMGFITNFWLGPVLK